MAAPVGTGATGMRSAFFASGLLARPLMISYSVPSPPTAAITLPLSVSLWPLDLIVLRLARNLVRCPLRAAQRDLHVGFLKPLSQ